MLPTHAPQNSRFNFRDAGIFILNLLVAVMGTAALVFPFTFFPRQQGAVVLKSDLLTADFLNVLAAFGLGYFPYRNWRPTASKWIWLFGLCWFVCGALRALDASNGAALWEISREDAAFDLDSSYKNFYNLQSFYHWLLFTLPLLRTVFYSAGAFCCSRVGRYGPTAIEVVFHRLFRPPAT